MNFSGSYDTKLRQDTLQQELEAQQMLIEEEAANQSGVTSKKRLSQDTPPIPSERTINVQGSNATNSGKSMTPLEKMQAQLAHLGVQNSGNVGNPPNTQSMINQQQLKVAERLARQLHELERKKSDDLKRKRDEEEELYRSVRRKVEDQRVKIDDEERQANQKSSELYAIFNDLQGIAKDFNINFEYPEIVVVGMQSDGKSSFIEGLLGFQFNIVESNIGTRRPLIIQMINDPSKRDPLCRFRKENPSPSDNNPFEEVDTPVHKLLDEIIRRTNDKAGIGDRVSSIPIILRVEYCHCANLTIYDTPGFRLGGDDLIRNDIQQMVMRLIEPKHRIIVCLEQSTVEWANTVSRPIVRSVDPDFSRTILVNTKFDNRVKELRTPESANKYLVGEALPPNTRPFFISMPLRRNMDSHRFKEMMKEAFLEDYQKLLEVGFDEKKFANQLGMFRVKSHLEKILFDKYQQSLAPTLRTLEELCKKTESELSQVKKELNQHDIELLKNKATLFVRLFVRTIDQLLAGSISGNPEKSGETLPQEKMNSGADWPDFAIDFGVQGAKFKVYGGAQYARLLNEFEYVAHSREFPRTTPSEIASALGVSKWNALETAASNLVQIKAKQAFVPLIDVVLSRCSYIMKRLFSISIEILKTDKDSQGVGILSVYERFQNELRTTYEQIIDKIENDCRARLKDDFVMFTRMVDWDLLSASITEPADYNYLDPSAEDTKKRVNELMQKSIANIGASNAHEDNYTRVAMMAAKMFASIRFFFVKYVRNKMNAFFLDPMQQEVGSFVINHFYKLPEQKYEDMFFEGVEELKLLSVKLENQLQACTKQRDKFKETYMKMKHSSEEVFKKVGM